MPNMHHYIMNHYKRYQYEYTEYTVKSTKEIWLKPKRYIFHLNPSFLDFSNIFKYSTQILIFVIASSIYDNQIWMTSSISR